MSERGRERERERERETNLTQLIFENNFLCVCFCVCVCVVGGWVGGCLCVCVWRERERERERERAIAQRLHTTKARGKYGHNSLSAGLRDQEYLSSPLSHYTATLQRLPATLSILEASQVQ